MDSRFAKMLENLLMDSETVEDYNFDYDDNAVTVFWDNGAFTEVQWFTNTHAVKK